MSNYKRKLVNIGQEGSTEESVDHDSGDEAGEESDEDNDSRAIRETEEDREESETGSPVSPGRRLNDTLSPSLEVERERLKEKANPLTKVKR